ADQRGGQGPGGQAAEGVIPGNAASVRGLRGPRVDPAESAPLVGGRVRGPGGSVHERPGVKRQRQGATAMTKHWCVNFDFEDCLPHGIHRKLWLMQYQYADGQGHVFQDGKQRAATTKNWRRMEDIGVGDRFVAYLRGNKFYAVGTVIAPRRARTPVDPTD